MDACVTGTAARRVIDQQFQQHYYLRIPQPWLELAVSRDASPGAILVFQQLFQTWYRCGCQPAQVNRAYLARMTGRSQRSIQRDLQELEDLNLIRQHSRHCPRKGQLRNDFDILINAENCVEISSSKKRVPSPPPNSRPDAATEDLSPASLRAHSPCPPPPDDLPTGSVAVELESGGGPRNGGNGDDGGDAEHPRGNDSIVHSAAPVKTSLLSKLSQVRQAHTGREAAAEDCVMADIEPQAFAAEKARAVLRRHHAASRRKDAQQSIKERAAATRAARKAKPGTLDDASICSLAKKLATVEMSDETWTAIVYTGLHGWAPRTLSSPQHTVNWLCSAVRDNRWTPPKQASRVPIRSKTLDAVGLSFGPRKDVHPPMDRMSPNIKTLPTGRFNKQQAARTPTARPA